jgi:biotin carboxyl carrier protein
MRYKVRIGGRTFEAEVGNVDARPIVVLVEGERFEVWPEAEAVQAERALLQAEPAQAEGIRAAAERTPAEANRASAQGTRLEAESSWRGAAAKVRAPIPGVIDSVAVRPGDEVGAGDPLCVIEAMKMKNVIRASRPGTVDDVLVTPGQHVHHDDVLFEFAE